VIKFVALLKKKADMSREAFIDYYESNHVPLIKECIPSIAHYRRSYVLAEHMFVAGHNADVAPPPPTFDVVTELWFESMEKYQEMYTATADPAVGGRIMRDEENFLDRSWMQMFLVDERISED
jgi:uncharacterized protein (TIGR02118 family)